MNLKINKGEFLYVVGDSGAGKTTLLKMLFGEESPNRGVIEIFGQNLSKADSGSLQALRRRMGVIFQDLRLIDELTAYDNVALSLETAKKGSRVRSVRLTRRWPWLAPVVLREKK